MKRPDRNHCPNGGKFQYFSRFDAEQNMVEHYKKYRDLKRVPCGAYLCPKCHYWHLTSDYDNRTPHCRTQFVNLDAHWEAKARKRARGLAAKKLSEERAGLRKQGLLPPKKKPTLKAVTLSYAEQQKAFALLRQPKWKRWLHATKNWFQTKTEKAFKKNFSKGQEEDQAH